MKLPSRLSNWKEKAKERGQIIRVLKQKLKRKDQQIFNHKLKYQKLEAILQMGEASERAGKPFTKVARHHYSGELIKTSLDLYVAGNIPVRAIPRVLSSLKDWLALTDKRVPDHSTLHTWIRKTGLHAMENIAEKAAPREQWVLMADESIKIGKEVLLLVIGVPLSKYTRGPVSFAHSRLLYAATNSSWHAQAIKAVLDKVAAGLEGNISHVVIDGGNSLNAAVKKTPWLWVRDCTHKMAEILRNTYGKDQGFAQLCKWLKVIRQKGILSDFAPFLPPQQRSKARFLNISEICIWAEKVLAHLPTWQQSNEKLYAFLSPILTYKPLLQELIAVNKSIVRCLSVLKNGNACFSSIKQVYKSFVQLVGQKAKLVAHKTREYIADLLSKGLPIVCSDVIESLFGKLKEKMGKASLGFSSLVLSLGVETGPALKLEDVVRACSEKKCRDIKTWEHTHLKVSFTRLKKGVWQQ